MEQQLRGALPKTSPSHLAGILPTVCKSHGGQIKTPTDVPRARWWFVFMKNEICFSRELVKAKNLGKTSLGKRLFYGQRWLPPLFYSWWSLGEEAHERSAQPKREAVGSTLAEIQPESGRSGREVPNFQLTRRESSLLNLHYQRMKSWTCSSWLVEEPQEPSSEWDNK